MINKFICFDLEGPLSPGDNAYKLMKLLPNDIVARLSISKAGVRNGLPLPDGLKQRYEELFSRPL